MSSKKRFLLVLALATVLNGCAENRSTWFIQQIQVPSSDCVIEPDDSALYQTAGMLDIAFRSNYVLTPLIRNNMTARADAENLVTESNGIQIEGANIRIWRGGRPEGSTIYSFYQPASSYVGPEGLSASSFVVVPDVAVDALIRIAFEGDDPSQLGFNDLLPYDELITLGIVMLGTTNGGNEVETPEFFFPVRLCFGCLVFCPAESGNIEENLEICESQEAPEGSTCLFGQAEAIDCRWAVPIYGLDNAQTFCGIN